MPQLVSIKDVSQIKVSSKSNNVMRPALLDRNGTSHIEPCLESDIFPTNTQIAKVTVLFKKRNREDVNNYGPVTTLPIFLPMKDVSFTYH